ncbi:MAG: heavy metal translocating P-type ATPase [Bacteroidetes bacterium]|nr:MAG: heavy metal translocating P-type ATPase [Bacteroidota bacterium]
MLGRYTTLYFALFAGLLLLIGHSFTFFESLSGYSIVCYVLSFFFSSFFTVQGTLLKLQKGKFEIDFLMVVAACGAAYLDKWAEGALLLFLFSLGHALEHYALGKAEKAISALGKLAPETALVKKGKEFVKISVKELRVGDTVLVKSYAKIAADAVVISGRSSVNQASITGESMPSDKEPFEEYQNEDFKELSDKHKVFTGTINGAGPLEVKVLRTSEYSTISRMIQMVKEAQAKQSPTQQFTQKIEKYYVPTVLLLVVLLCFVFLLGIETFPESLYRALTVLVASSPCALAISTPGTVLSGIARGAQNGVLFKGGAALENLGSVSAIAFDKTGTLTEGKPRVVKVIPHRITKEELLSLTMSIEAFSNHPLALSIVAYAKNEKAAQFTIAQETVNVLEGKGVEAIYDGEKVRIGKLSFLSQTAPNSLTQQIKELEKDGCTLVGVSRGKDFLGIFALLDKPKAATASMLASLKELGIPNFVMLTGDRKDVADSIGRELGITEIASELLPVNKVAAIEDLRNRYQKVAMVGDGVNDAPAMAMSTASVAIGAAGSDVALETADIALLSDNIRQLPFAVGLSRKAKCIIKQNLFISIGSIALLIPLAIANLTGIGITVFLHEGTTILVIANALRLLSFTLKEK